MDQNELLSRPGLTPRLRLLVMTLVATWRADWARLSAASAAGRDRGVPRADFVETLLQAVLFCGFPRVVTAFDHFSTAWPTAAAPAGGTLPPAEQPAAGRALFAAIYGKNDAAVRAMLRGYHEEFHDFVLDAAYGRILSRPGLDPGVRELLAVGVLAAMDQRRQFAAHARGALHFGISHAQLREALVTAFGEQPEVDEWLALVRVA